MGFFKEKPWYAAGNSQRVTSVCFVVIAVIAITDAILLPPVGLGMLYLIPLAVAAVFASRWQIIILAAICSAFWEAFSNLPAGPERIARLIFIFISYSFVAVLINRIAVHGRAATRRYKEVESDIPELQQSQYRTELLLNSVPVAILTVSGEGTIAECNRAAHELFAVGLGGMPGQPVVAFIPDFDQLSKNRNGAPATSILRQANGTTFNAEVRICMGGPDGQSVVVAERSS